MILTRIKFDAKRNDEIKEFCVVVSEENYEMVLDVLCWSHLVKEITDIEEVIL